VSSTQDPYPIPKEIWFLVDHLYRHGLKQPHLFEQPGLNSELLQIRNWLDNGSPDPMRILNLNDLLFFTISGTSSRNMLFKLVPDKKTQILSYNCLLLGSEE
jgi:hypothetical protein